MSRMATPAAAPVEPRPRLISRISTSSTLVPGTSNSLEPLHLQFGDLKGKQIFIGRVPSDDQDAAIAPSDIVYVLELHTLNPKLTFYRRGGQGNTYGTIMGKGCPHSLSSKIDIIFPAARSDAAERHYQITPASAWPDKTSYDFVSSTFEDGDGALLTWSSESLWKKWDLVCVNSKGAPVARFVRGDLASRSVGRIEFIGDHLVTSVDEPDEKIQAKIDEIVVVGISLAHDVLKVEAKYINQD